MQGGLTQCKDMSPDNKRSSELQRRGHECILGEIISCLISILLLLFQFCVLLKSISPP